MTARFAGLPHLTADPTPDAELLRRYAAERDEVAFRELVRRHGRLVFGVCRRAVGDLHLAEDAFQAVFLVLARKAAGVRDGSNLASWLHGVAVRVSTRAQRAERRRRWKAGLELEPAAAPRPIDPELISAVDAEIDRLPETYRVPLILCELEGVSRSAAAALLKLPEGTLSSRLAAGRKRLAANLTRRGVVLGVVLAAPVTVPAAVLESTIELTSGGRVPVELLTLAFGRPAMRTMILAGVTLMAAVGAAAVAQQDPPVPPKPPEAVKSVGVKPAEPGPAYSTKPKMRRTLDIRGSVEKFFWSADGTRIAIVCWAEIKKDKPPVSFVVFAAVDPPPDRAQVLAVFDVPGERRVTDVQLDADTFRLAAVYDSGGRINAVRRAEVWEFKLPTNDKPTPAAPNVFSAGDGVPFKKVLDEALPPGDYATPYFSGGGKDLLLLTVGSERKKTGVARVGLAELDGEADDTVKPLLGPKLPEGATFKWFRADAAARALFTIDSAGALMRHSSAKAGGIGAVQYGTVPVADDYYTAVAQTGSKVAVAPSLKSVERDVKSTRDLPKAYVYAPGAAPVLLKLDGLLPTDLHSFSSDGRLVCGMSREYTAAQRGDKFTFTVSQTTAVTVWDANTGDRVKQWEGAATTAFAPRKPLLAVAEELSDTRSRIGFWDFSPTK